MANANIIATPNVNGNIGSCTTQSVEVVSARPSLWWVETKEIVTNSCTGEVKEYNSWTTSGLGDVGIFAGVSAVIVLLFVIFAVVTDL